ncbi:hypothetical protein OG792_32760 [Micromonospora sp. NBC_01699]|uniref:hypothetical protein n=1 Tax=Micromonospora sp. NBC_01699 TaxID=2975984 RepID=UPI002E2E3B80|nr:hypothetical protein [Micromonospora sp. NBC_01699]
MSDELAPAGALDEVRGIALDAVHEWASKYPVPLPGWALIPVARNDATGELSYSLVPYSPAILDRPTRNITIRIVVEDACP